MPAPRHSVAYRGKRVATGRTVAPAGVKTSSSSTAAERAKRQQSNSVSRQERGRLWRLGISAVILISAVVIKLFAPQILDTCRDQLLMWIGEDTDFVAAFSAMGRAVGLENNIGDALNDAYVAVFGNAAAEEEEENLSSQLVYTAQNLPQQVDMTQHILGFAYASPLCGTLTDRFGYREHPVDAETRFHYGLDIEAKTGDVISAFADGTVTTIGESAELGKYLTILHANGYTTLYAHCSRITASSGQLVKLGDPVAEAGQSGNATGPHLHFELHADTVYLNPIYYVTLQKDEG